MVDMRGSFFLRPEDDGAGAGAAAFDGPEAAVLLDEEGAGVCLGGVDDLGGCCCLSWSRGIRGDAVLDLGKDYLCCFCIVFRLRIIVNSGERDTLTSLRSYRG
jgi:hypothetical protein